MKKKIAITAASIAVLLLATSAVAGRGGPPGGPDGMHMGKLFRPEMVEMIAADLGVADSVVKQIKDKAYKADQDAIKLRADLDAAHLEMRRLMDEEKPDVARIMKQTDVVGGLETELKKNRIRLLLSVRELLTPEQRRKLQKLLMERFDNRGRGMGPGNDDDVRGMGPGSRRRGNP